jgi:hypothetical protein
MRNIELLLQPGYKRVDHPSGIVTGLINGSQMDQQQVLALVLCAFWLVERDPLGQHGLSNHVWILDQDQRLGRQSIVQIEPLLDIDWRSTVWLDLFLAVAPHYYLG